MMTYEEFNRAYLALHMGRHCPRIIINPETFWKEWRRFWREKNLNLPSDPLESFKGTTIEQDENLPPGVLLIIGYESAPMNHPSLVRPGYRIIKLREEDPQWPEELEEVESPGSPVAPTAEE